MVNAGDHEEPKDPKFRPEGVNGGSPAAGEGRLLRSSLSMSLAFIQSILPRPFLERL